jgi:hypothetical protein
MSTIDAYIYFSGSHDFAIGNANANANANTNANGYCQKLDTVK